jgi:CRP/FNR family transcriptional regulator, cyclic AMP receptor protein
LHHLSWTIAVTMSVSLDTIVAEGESSVQRRPNSTLDEDHTRLISGVDHFAPLSPASIERIAQGIPSKRFEVGTHVFTPACRGEIFFLLLEGRVRVYRLEAVREFTIGVLEPGEMFGEAAYISREGGGSYAQAIAPSRVAGAVRLAGRRIVVEDAVALQRIAEDAA